MAINYNTSDTKATLLKIAVESGIKADESMTKAQIIAALDAYNAADPEQDADDETDTEGEQGGTGEGKAPEGTGDTDMNEAAAQGAQDGTDEPEAQGTTEDTPAAKSATQGSTAAENSEHVSFAYAGPSLPHGRLKENAVFRGKIADVLQYLADVMEDYPQVEKLIVPTTRLAAFRAKVKTPGNIAHKYYNDIVLAMRGNKEV